jgi:hypothetical protein
MILPLYIPNDAPMAFKLFYAAIMFTWSSFILWESYKDSRQRKFERAANEAFRKWITNGQEKK